MYDLFSNVYTYCISVDIIIGIHYMLIVECNYD